MGRIADIVNETFDDLDSEAFDALVELDALADKMEIVPDDVFALAVVGLVKARTEKQSAEQDAAVIKQLLPALLALI